MAQPDVEARSLPGNLTLFNPTLSISIESLVLLNNSRGQTQGGMFYGDNLNSVYNPAA